MNCPNCNRRTLPGAVACSACGLILPIGGAAKGKRDAVKTASKPERRPMTVLFSDLVNSVGLSNELDAEELMRLLDRYLTLCDDIVTERGGFLAKFMGDGVLAYFGYPNADEDNAANAVNAGLDIVVAVREMDVATEVSLQARIGIATGLVLISDRISRANRRSTEIVGRIPNLAARLQSVARPDTVVISDATRRVTRGFFSYQDLGKVSLKGFAQPVQAWEVKASDAAVTRFQARLQGEPSPFVGRRAEFELLQRLWANARDGQGQVVEILGEPGMGKSRLTERFDEHLALDPAPRIRWFCAPQHADSAFYPVAQQLERAASITREDTASDRIGKLIRLLAQSGPPDPTTLAVFAELLSISVDGPSPLNAMTPEKRKELTMNALLALSMRLCAVGPLIILVEDAHWIDATTLELLDLVVQHIDDQPALLIVTARPDFKPSWARRKHVTLMNLTRLDSASAGEVCAHVAAGTLPLQVVEQLIERSDGIPFYVEELTRAVVESLEMSGNEKADAGAAEASIPLSLHDSLVARLDRLGSAREIANIGAVIGRQFDYELLAAVAAKPTSTLRSALGALKRSGVVNQTGSPPASRYLFRHVLMRDAAYDSMMSTDRQALHSQVAAALQTNFPDLRDAEPEVVAYHLTRSSAPADAIPYWQKAGQKATARGGNVEAIGHYNAALELVKLLPDDVARVQQELSCLLPLAVSLAASQGYAADEVRDVLTRARAICSLMGDASPLFPVLHGLSKFWSVRGDQVAAEELIRSCVKIGEQTGDPRYIVEADATLSYVLYVTAQLGEQLLFHIERAPRLYDENEAACQEISSEANAKTSALSVAPVALYVMGDGVGAERAYQKALVWARSLNRPFDLAHTLCFTTLYLIWRKDYLQAKREAEEAVAICEAYGFVVWLQCARAYLAVATGHLGQIQEARELLVAAMAAWKKAGCNTLLGFLSSHLALFEAAAGRLDDALNLADQAIELTIQQHDFIYLPTAHRVRASILAKFPTPDFALVAAELRKALAIARSQRSAAIEAEIVAELEGMPVLHCDPTS